jgi:hypothetical protein
VLGNTYGRPTGSFAPLERPLTRIRLRHEALLSRMEVRESISSPS